jgi:5'-deoxynucleotidase YfbR-like HD superfamily hydrolase
MLNDSSHDVFLSHNSLDKAQVRDLKTRLTAAGLKVWLDEDELRPGLPWQKLLEEAIRDSKSIAVLIGSSGVGPWEKEELEAALIYAVKNERPVIPVFLPGARLDIVLPPFLSNRGKVDLRPAITEKNLNVLIWGITGQRPSDPTANRVSPQISNGRAAEKNRSVAEHALDLLLKHEWRAVETAYRDQEDVTIFIKQLVNSSPQMQQDTLNSIEQIYDSAPTLEKVKLAYILGRLAYPPVRQKALFTVSSYLNQHAASVEHTANDSRSLRPSREQLLLERTLYISMAYLGSIEAANAYLNMLLRDPTIDEINRDFHLQYYGDASSASLSEMGEPPATATFSVLLQRLRNDVSSGRAREMTEIELQTVVSLAVPRHLIGKLSDDIRASILGLLNDVRLSNTLKLQTNVMSLIDAGVAILQKDEINAGAVAAELHALKGVKRVGWARRGVVGGESVADHIWGSMLLADMFLPEAGNDTKLNDQEYRKERVMQMLLIHDLPEAFLKDKIPSEKTEADSFNEAAVMRRISALGALSCFNGARGWTELFVEYNRGVSLNAQLARDFETIDTIFQLRRYSEDPVYKIPDANEFAAAQVARLKTDFCRRLIARLLCGGEI